MFLSEFSETCQQKIQYESLPTLLPLRNDRMRQTLICTLQCTFFRPGFATYVAFAKFLVGVIAEYCQLAPQRNLEHAR